jgi:hypothetical protein
MKKLFAILAVASVMTACNNSGDAKTEEKKDSAAAAPSMAAEAQKADSLAKVAADSGANKMQAAGDSIKAGASKMMEGVKEGAKEVGKEVKEGANKMVDKAKEAVKH